MLKSLVCAMLLVMSMGILNASEAAGRAVVKKFWKSISYYQLDIMEYITDDFILLDQEHKKDREQVEKCIRLFNQGISLAKKQKYAEAAEIFIKLAELSRVKTEGIRYPRKFSDLSPEKQQRVIARIKKLANTFPQRYHVLKNQAMKITSFSISGDQATAMISFPDAFEIKTAEIKLKKVNEKWLVSQITLGFLNASEAAGRSSLIFLPRSSLRRILNASEAAGRAVVKKFWKSYSYYQLDIMEYITDDFILLYQGHKKDREQVEKCIRLFNQGISLAKKQKYAEAAEIFIKLAELSSVKTEGIHYPRKFSDLSPEKQQLIIERIKKLANSFRDKYHVQKNQAMKITSFSISGDQATAMISFPDVLEIKTAEIKLKKVNGKWLVSQITFN